MPELIGKKKKQNVQFSCSSCGNKTVYPPKNKIFDKGIILIKKYLQKNEWKLVKGNFGVSM